MSIDLPAEDSTRDREGDVLSLAQIFSADGELVFTGEGIGPSMVKHSLPASLLEMSVEDFKEAFNDHDNLEVFDLGVATGENYKP